MAILAGLIDWLEFEQKTTVRRGPCFGSNRNPVKPARASLLSFALELLPRQPRARGSHAELR